MDIARDVANLRSQQAGNVVNETAQERTHFAAHQNAQRQSRGNSIQLPRTISPRSEQEQPQRTPNNRRHQTVERAHRHGRAGSPEATILTAPPREEWPVLAIGDDILPMEPLKATTAVKPKPSVKVQIKPAARQNAAAKLNHAGKAAKARGVSIAVKAALFAALMLAGTSVMVLALQGKLPFSAHDWHKQAVAETTSTPAEVTSAKPQLAAAAADHTSALYPFAMPDTYGVYAVSNGQLTALEPLPIRIPDARVSISSTVTKPPAATVASGAPLFVVYHRELANHVPEGASVRVFAKVMQASTFVGGKPKAIPVEDAWAVRGGAIDLRIAPVAANKEMILIRPGDPNFTLSPGRYVLMFRNQAYDFSVAGEISDTAQCLERSDLQDRSVYSECRELPAAAAKS